MGGRQRAVRVVATHRYVKDPETAERALEMWARYLATSVGSQLGSERYRVQERERKQAGLPY
ncbi:MAG: hypothetical protein K0R39_1147 [Symbiobacteriaceae bacterium]|jgi:hypothetical protein|nr:hypothetical protein [Symbiobacteriaceae bacterium]